MFFSGTTMFETELRDDSDSIKFRERNELVTVFYVFKQYSSLKQNDCRFNKVVRIHLKHYGSQIRVPAVPTTRALFIHVVVFMKIN